MKNIIYLFIIISLFLLSCETEVKVNIDDANPRLVSESYLNFDSETNMGYASIFLTKSSQYYDDSDPSRISNATVTINDNILLFEDPDSVGFYSTDQPIFYNDELIFKINILAEIDGVAGSWSATDNFIEVPSIDSIYYYYEETSSTFQEAGYYVKIIFNDPPSQENYYCLDVLVDSEDLFTLNPGTKWSSIFQDRYINGQELNFIVNDEPIDIGSEVTVVLSSISEQTYFYYFNLYTLMTETQDIGAAPPFPLNGNLISNVSQLENGLGNFQVRNYSYKSIQILN